MAKMRLPAIRLGLFTVLCLSGARAVSANPQADLLRADAICLRQVSFVYDVPLRGTMARMAGDFCVRKTPGSLDLVLPASALGIRGFTFDLPFTGVMTAPNRITWRINHRVASCVEYPGASGATERAFVDTISGSLDMEVTSLPMPSRDVALGSPTVNLAALRPAIGAGLNTLAIGANLTCPPGLLGGTVVLRNFVFTGHASAEAELASHIPRPPTLAAIMLTPGEICQEQNHRARVPFAGIIALSAPAWERVPVTLTAGSGVNLKTTAITIEQGARTAAFVGDIRSDAVGMAEVRATGPSKRQVTGLLPITVFDEQVISRDLACGGLTRLENESRAEERQLTIPLENVSRIDQLLSPALNSNLVELESSQPEAMDVAPHEIP